MMKIFHFVLSALALSILVSGCVKGTRVGVEATVTEATNDYGELVFFRSVEYENTDLKKKVGIVDPMGRKKGDLLQASITIVNLKKQPIAITYKFMWFDKDGFEISPEGYAWVPLKLQGFEKKSVQALGPNPGATQFLIKVSENK